MKHQNYKTHKRYLIGYHGITFTLILILLISAIYSLYISIKTQFDIRVSIMFLITASIFTLFFYYIRAFATKAQDRAIKVEENFRHFILTGKMLDHKLTYPQIIALRFAEDEEFLQLIKKSIQENLSSKDIKTNIKNWRADNYRV